MAIEPMTLIERLRNPQWSGAGNLDPHQTRKDMEEAATAIEDLARMAAKFLTRIAVQTSNELPSENGK